MKKIQLLILLIGSFLFANAQYTSPGTFKTLNMDSLVNLSSGTVVDSGSFYRVTKNVTIARKDTLKILSSKTIKIDSGILIQVNGTIQIDPLDSVKITNVIAGKNFKGINIDSSNTSYLRHAIIENGGGMRLTDANVFFDNCVIRNNSRINATNAINLFRSNPVIQHCVFSRNAGSAIGGGANIANAPIILYNIIYGNNTQNTNIPQINLGATGAATTIVRGNKIIGNRSLIMAGGIAIFPIGQANSVIDSNEIRDNRYGITLTGSNNFSVIGDNQIIDNNTQNNPNLGGSGLNFNGDTTNRAIVYRNYIAGNLWGATIQVNARPNFGDGMNIGENHFTGNGNNGDTIAIYNNTPQNIKAENNQWENYTTLSQVDSVITHKNDIASLGFVDYDPFIGQVHLITDYISPGTSKKLTLDSIVNDISGAVVDSGTFYLVRANITISATDTLDIVDNGKSIKIDSALSIEVPGTMRVTGDIGRLLITATDTTKNFKGINFYNSDKSFLRNVIVEYGGGIRLIESDIDISNSIFRRNNTVNAESAVYLSGSSPRISTSEFVHNEGMAISSLTHVFSAPWISDNFIASNIISDAQINLGASGTDTIRLLTNHIEGNTTGGGISIKPVDFPANVIMENNTVFMNSYGISVVGTNIFSRIKDNIISNNTSVAITGTGLIFNGDTTNTAMVTGNLFTGNERGMIIAGSSRPNLGEIGVNPGNNTFMFNGENGDTVAVYNAGLQTIKAENNTWMNFTTLAQVERIVFHKNDVMALGLVDFDPFIGQTTGIPREKLSNVKVYPQPAVDVLTIDADVKLAELFDINGRLVKRVENTNKINVRDLDNGIYMLKINENRISKIVISR